MQGDGYRAELRHAGSLLLQGSEKEVDLGEAQLVRRLREIGRERLLLLLQCFSEYVGSGLR